MNKTIYQLSERNNDMAQIENLVFCPPITEAGQKDECVHVCVGLTHRHSLCGHICDGNVAVGYGH